jgi:cobalt-zinc-cadmium efflux system membrane fusion protein
MRNTVIGLVIGLVIGVAVALVTTGAARTVMSKLTSEHSEDDGHGHGHGHGHGEEVSEEEALTLTAEQIQQSGITLEEAKEGDLVRTTTFPGSVIANPDRIAIVAAKAPGVVVDVKKRLGETVAKGELLAILESREIAEVKGELLAAQRTESLARSTFEREKNLFEKKISSEQDYLTARTALEEARIRVDLARQKLAAFGLAQADVARMNSGSGALQVLEVRSPIEGRIVERKATAGASVGSETELFTVADLKTIWIEAAVAPSDLAFVKEGNSVSVEGQGKTTGQVVFVSPVVDRDTRLAKVIVQIANPDSTWRPGDFASVTINSSSEKAGVLVPKGAIQRMKKDQVVFVRTEKGFERRDVVLGRSDGNQVEIRFGVDAGESVAVANSFVLKAQLEKAEAEHAH